MRRSKYNGRFTNGQKIGKWTVVDANVTMDGRGRAHIKCTCDCGEGDNIYVQCHHLVSGRSTKCENCNYSERGRGVNKNPNWRGTGHIPKSTLTTISHSCVNNDVEFNLTMNYLSDLYHETGNCTYTGVPIDPAKDGKLVRIDKSEGYVEGNVAWVHNGVANYINTYSSNEFVTMCYMVTGHLDSSSTTTTTGETENV